MLSLNIQKYSSSPLEDIALLQRLNWIQKMFGEKRNSGRCLLMDQQ